MAQESCNLDKEEAEILKPSSASSSPAHKEEAEILKSSSNSSLPTASQSSSSSSSQTTLFMNSLHEFSAKNSRKRQRPTEENRCLSCRKKVGLMGFRCRCGDLFCGQHRYSDTHDCSFDYKAFGREQISKANPVIRAAKIIKI